MTDTSAIRIRLAACRETAEGEAWTFHVINDSAVAFDSVLLEAVGYEWGDIGRSEAVNVRVGGLAPGAHASIWRDDGSGAELRMDFSLRVRAGALEVALRFEFPILYRRTSMPVVEGLGRPGVVGHPIG